MSKKGKVGVSRGGGGRGRGGDGGWCERGFMLVITTTETYLESCQTSTIGLSLAN